MEYQTAKDIRGRSLTSMITSKMLAGGGVVGSTRSAISQKMRAKATGIKEKFDPMNVARFMTGGSRFATVAMGRMTGRSQSDIEYFAGERKKKTYSRIEKTAPPQLNASSMDALNQMFDFFKRIDERDTKRAEIERAFREEKEYEAERRHNEFISVLKNFLVTGPGTPGEIKKEEEKSGLFNALGAVLSTMFSTFKSLISTLTNLFKFLLKPIFSTIKKLLGMFFTGIIGLTKSLFGLFLRALSWIPRLLPFFARLLPLLGKIGLVIGIPLALIEAGRRALQYIANNMKDFSQLTPQEARNVLDNANLRDVERYPGGLEALKDVAGRDELNPYVDNKTFPSRDELLQRMPETVPSLDRFVREGSTGLKREGQEAKWKELYGKYYDPATGLRSDLVDFVGPFKTDPKTGRLLSAMAISQEDKANISAMTTSPDENVGLPPPSPVIEPSVGNFLLEGSADLARQRNGLMGSAPNARGILNNQSNRVPLPDAPDPKAADIRNRTKIFQKTIEKNLAPI